MRQIVAALQMNYVLMFHNSQEKYWKSSINWASLLAIVLDIRRLMTDNESIEYFSGVSLSRLYISL
jgi:hypothetical protein